MATDGPEANLDLVVVLLFLIFKIFFLVLLKLFWVCALFLFYFFEFLKGLLYPLCFCFLNLLFVFSF